MLAHPQYRIPPPPRDTGYVIIYTSDLENGSASSASQGRIQGRGARGPWPPLLQEKPGGGGALAMWGQGGQIAPNIWLRPPPTKILDPPTGVRLESAGGAVKNTLG